MSLTTALLVYLLIWWLTLFAVLPFGVKRHEETGKGFDSGAPTNPQLGKKLIINSILAAAILGIIQLLITTGVIEWHAAFKDTLQ